jgi:hypothetical protein
MNADVYAASCQDIVLSALHGINGTIFMYGQTGAGKTYTMLGDYSSEILKNNRKSQDNKSPSMSKTPIRKPSSGTSPSFASTYDTTAMQKVSSSSSSRQRGSSTLRLR